MCRFLQVIIIYNRALSVGALAMVAVQRLLNDFMIESRSIVGIVFGRLQIQRDQSQG